VGSIGSMRRRSLSFVAALCLTAVATLPVSAAAPPTVQVTIRSMRYDPVTLSVAEGTRVRWNNVTSPSRAHDVVSSLPGYIQSPLLVNGQSFDFTFAAAGTFSYICSIHDVMIGAVEVPLQAELVTTGRRPYFLLTLGTALLPTTSRYRYVLNWQMPGEHTWHVKASRDNTLVVLAAAPGTYHFRARLKDKVGGTRSANSPVVALDSTP
jgi:plastocyanin